MGRKGSEGGKGHVWTRLPLNTVNHMVFFESFGNLPLLRCGNNISFSCHISCNSVDHLSDLMLLMLIWSYKY
jgi:hypothetical protein